MKAKQVSVLALVMAGFVGVFGLTNFGTEDRELANAPEKQNTSSQITGIVFDDENNNQIMDGDEEGTPNQTIRIEKTDKSYSREVKTNNNGEFSISSLPFGDFEISLKGNAKSEPKMVSITQEKSQIQLFLAQ